MHPIIVKDFSMFATPRTRSAEKKHKIKKRKKSKLCQASVNLPLREFPVAVRNKKHNKSVAHPYRRQLSPTSKSTHKSGESIMMSSRSSHRGRKSARKSSRVEPIRSASPLLRSRSRRKSIISSARSAISSGSKRDKVM